MTIGELAERCFYSKRHVRTLLYQTQEAEWLGRQASSERGKCGQFSFHRTPENLRNEIMEQAPNNGRQQNALELMQLVSVELKALLHPFLGDQWQNNIPTLCILYHRPLEPLRPGFLPGYVEQHLIEQICAGLTRFDEGDNMSIGNLAHHWQVSPNGLR